ncbi:MAG: molybdopterin synthase sulfur carrier subunit [Alphaproteobacteria bacterium]|nr:molybdopterin synthase sulfur carrier subunit [Alphaproteobacteria bacterium]
MTLPPGIATVGALVDWLRKRGPNYAEALSDLGVVRIAVNQEHVGLDAPVRDGDEVALFPPVTGGSA